MKNLEDKTVATTTNQAYVKPEMEMYEMEVESAIMGDASDGGYYERSPQEPS